MGVDPLAKNAFDQTFMHLLDLTCPDSLVRASAIIQIACAYFYVTSLTLASHFMNGTTMARQSDTS